MTDASGPSALAADLAAGLRLNHVGMVVADRDAASQRLGPLLGLRGTFPLDMDFTSLLVRGEETHFRLAGSFAWLGGVYLEMLQPLDDRSPHAAVLAERGECFHHLCYGVEDLDAEMARFEAAGMSRLIDATGPANPARWVYLEGPGPDSTVIELFQSDDGSDALFEQIAAVVK